MPENKSDRLVIEYDYFAEDDVHVLSVIREEKDEVIEMFEGSEAAELYELLTRNEEEN